MFENLEKANEEYEKLKADYDKVTKEKDDLNIQFTNQKAILEENKTNIDNLNKEVNRLKIKNYEFFEQLNNQNTNTNTGDTPPKKEESTPTINDILKMF